MKHTVSFVSLGCAKNQVDCEQMMYLMSQAGWEIHPEPEDVDLVVINTCAVPFFLYRARAYSSTV